MSAVSPAIRKIVGRFRAAKRAGITLASTSGGDYVGRQLPINGRTLTSYASCSYLGLELDPRMKAAAIRAIESAGTYFSTSRTYLQMGEYEELEAQFGKVFGAPCLVSASTTLGHLAVMPALMSGRDAIVVDYQGHNSLQDATLLLKGKGAHREIVPHNDVTALRERLTKLCALYPKVWYVFDGVYSIYGDYAPFAEIRELLEEFPNLYLYCDDAHGMGWAGQHGRGRAYEMLGPHERLVFITSLAKSAACGGGVIVLPDEETKMVVRVTGKTLVFSGPITPSQLGAGLECTRILLSDELPAMQRDLSNICARFVAQSAAFGLNLIDHSDTPIFYVGIGDYPSLFTVAQRLRDEFGIFVTPTGYPAVPFNRCGLRITLTLAHTLEDIDHLVRSIATVYHDSLEENGISRDDMAERFAGGVAAAVA